MKKHYVSMGIVAASSLLLLALHILGWTRILEYIVSISLFVLACGIYQGCTDMAEEILNEYDREHRVTIDLVSKLITQVIVTSIGLSCLWFAGYLIAKGV